MIPVPDRAALAGLAAVAVLAMLTACGATPQQAEHAVAARFVGQPADAFFSRYGMPLQTMDTRDGGRQFSWRGGQAFVDHAAKVMPSGPAVGTERTHSHSQTTQTGPGSSVTRSSSSSVGFSIASPPVVVQPATHEELVCEAQITTDAKGIITAFHTTRDTRGGEMGRSRCAEVFGVKS